MDVFFFCHMVKFYYFIYLSLFISLINYFEIRAILNIIYYMKINNRKFFIFKFIFF